MWAGGWACDESYGVKLIFAYVCLYLTWM